MYRNLDTVVELWGTQQYNSVELSSTTFRRVVYGRTLPGMMTPSVHYYDNTVHEYYKYYYNINNYCTTVVYENLDFWIFLIVLCNRDLAQGYYLHDSWGKVLGAESHFSAVLMSNKTIYTSFVKSALRE